MKMISFFLFFWIIPAFFSGSCSGNRQQQSSEANILASARDTVSISGKKIVLETYLWRDFMPISPPEGKPLRATITLLPVNSEGLPPGIDAEKIYVIHEADIWSAPLEPFGQPVKENPLKKLERMAANGPKWGPDIDVTVVVEIRDENGNTYLLKAENQPIHKTV